MRKRPRDKEFLRRLDEFLAAFDPEELIRDGIKAIRFHYNHKGVKYSEDFTMDKLKDERNQNAIRSRHSAS